MGVKSFQEHPEDRGYCFWCGEHQRFHGLGQVYMSCPDRSSHTPPHRNPGPPSSAPNILRKAAQHMDDRAAARDQPGGERSMKRTIDAFNAITGHKISERDGWMFMVALKMARACTTTVGLADDYEDLAAYAALAGECAEKHRTVEAVEEKL